MSQDDVFNQLRRQVVIGSRPVVSGRAVTVWSRAVKLFFLAKLFELKVEWFFSMMATCRT
jgi:hypothetical protein